jgi:mycoredoxin
MPDDTPIVYYKPGCPHSAALRAQLTLLRIPHRSVRFVLVGGEYLTNPSPRQVREAMASR